MARALGPVVVIYRPLSAGALTAKYLDGVPDGSRGEGDERIGHWTETYDRLPAFHKSATRRVRAASP